MKTKGTIENQVKAWTLAKDYGYDDTKTYENLLYKIENELLITDQRIIRRYYNRFELFRFKINQLKILNNIIDITENHTSHI